MSGMVDRKDAICDAAARMFIRYGVSRTGMNDIAREAGIARQTLYNIFPNKDAVLLATIRLFMGRALEETVRDLAGSDDLRGQLGIVFEHLVRRPYALVHTSPNAEDIIEGLGAESRAVISECRAGFRDIVEGLLTPAEAKVAQAGMTVRQLADATINFAYAAKYEASDQARLDELLQSLRAMVMRCTA